MAGPRRARQENGWWLGASLVVALVLLAVAVGAVLLTRASVQSRVMERSLDLQEVGQLGRAFSDKVALANSALLAGGQSLVQDTARARQRFLDTAHRLSTRLGAPEDQALVEEVRAAEQVHEAALRALLDTATRREQRLALERLTRAHGRVRDAQAQLERKVQARLARENQAALLTDRWEAGLLLLASLLGLGLASTLAWVLHRRLHPLKREAAASAHRFQALVEGVRDYALVLLDARGRVASWNPGAERIKGWSEAEILGRSTAVFYTSEEAAAGKPERDLSRALQEGRLRAEGWRQRKDGSRFWAELSITALRDEDGTPQGFSVVTRDITEHRRNERVQELLAEAGRVFHQSLDPDLTVAEVARLLVPEVADGCILYLLTPAGELRPRAVTHVQPEREASLWEALRRFPPRAGMPPVVWEVMRTRRSRMDVEVETEDVAASAETNEHRLLIERIAIGSSMVVPLRAGSETLGAFVLMTARGHRRFTQADQVLVEELAGRAALALVNTRLLREAREAVDLIAVTAHDLGNPLHALQLLLNKVQRAQGAGRDEDVRQGLVAARGQAQRLGQLLHNLLDLSRLSSGKRVLDAAPVDLGELAHEVVERFAEAAAQAGCDLKLEVEPGQVGQWDRIRLDRVVTNLLSNALKFGRGHPVTVSVSALDVEHTRLRVRDEGVGIAPEAQRRVFERYERERSARTEAGYGLGLYIARQLVEAHGGVIHVESVPGRGATFTVDLPRIPRLVEEMSVAEAPPLQQ
ncbi:sensor histidine kinase [Corallococcus aberystwythensis]|uniref:histidine kinase n=1 Tax=Corallococcus aberystwythensis TaxID=2316722 RepID=A0A3A8PFW3_9BACT|nr:PAS domain-containing sensor histidine kinase [Corallococcus aberystwythensis]RKH54869.1 PAS domain-containing sensor histidine kinase [Corallococcus aberystwythensis]